MNHNSGKNMYLKKIIFNFIIFLSFPLSGSTIAVFPFKEGHQKKEIAEGLLFARDIIAILQQQKRYDLIEQEDIEKIYKELQKGQTGLVDQESAAQLGYLKGIHYFIFGSISKKNHQYFVNYRIVHTETGTIIGAGRKQGSYEYVLNTISDQIINQLDIYLNLDNPNSPYTVLLKLNKEKPIYKIGETIEVRFKVISHRKDALKKVYIQLFSIDAKGKMMLIYPNKFSGFDPIEVGKEYKFPSEKDDFEWELTPPTGTEYIQAFVSEEPIEIFSSLTKAKKRSFPEIEGNGNDLVTYRGIKIQLNKKKRKNWSAMRVAYELVE